MNKDDAEKLSILLMQVSGKLDQSVRFVMDHDSKENFEKYRQRIGKVMGELFLEVLQPLWKEHPELLPEDMEGPYKVDRAIYEPYFYKPE
ncbi:hypothetical protein MD273_10860 [Marinobacter pelagius]|uniref:hypothetical protein n=1 Tax=Marinobacter sp. C7 TaxID=2951363 RepID=UPI001EF15268|nr:hypothetical protein [Marinobacter sp. C7]MCG7200223.1 hypothetical protein [Marinobacter sp. C7]